MSYARDLSELICSLCAKQVKITHIFGYNDANGTFQSTEVCNECSANNNRPTPGTHMCMSCSGKLGNNSVYSRFTHPNDLSLEVVLLYCSSACRDSCTRDIKKQIIATGTPVIYDCSHCHKQGGDFKKCARCKYTRYCSRECQSADWKKHKTECIPPSPMPA